MNICVHLRPINIFTFPTSWLPSLQASQPLYPVECRRRRPPLGDSTGAGFLAQLNFSEKTSEANLTGASLPASYYELSATSYELEPVGRIMSYELAPVVTCCELPSGLYPWLLDNPNLL